MADDEDSDDDKLVAPKPPEKRGLPKVGDVNILQASIGQRGTGKSTHQCYSVWLTRKRLGVAYVLGHSLGARLPDKLPDELGGHTLPISYYRTIPELDKGLRKHPERWHILAPDTRNHDAPSADDLIRYARRLSQGIRDAAYRKEHGLLDSYRSRNKVRRYTGLACVPICLLIDEGIAIDAAGTGSTGGLDKHKWFREFVYSIRHEHVAFFYAIQNASARSWHVMSEATTICAFSTRHAWALQNLRAAGATKEEVEQIANLPPYEHIDFGPATRKKPKDVKPVITDKDQAEADAEVKETDEAKASI